MGALQFAVGKGAAARTQTDEREGGRMIRSMAALIHEDLSEDLPNSSVLFCEDMGYVLLLFILTDNNAFKSCVFVVVLVRSRSG